MSISVTKSLYVIAPAPKTGRLTHTVSGLDHNRQEIVAAMTIGDYPECLGVGYLRNQGMFLPTDTTTGIDFDEEVASVIVRNVRETNYEDKLKKKARISGCAVARYLVT